VQEETEHLLTVSDAAAGGRLDRHLAAILEGFSRSQIQRAIRLGLVLVDGVTASKTGLSLQTGQEVFFQPPPAEPSSAVPQQIPLDVLFEDEHIVVVNKAAGMVVHPSKGHPDGTLVNALLGRTPKLGDLGPLRPGIVHRLDRGTSGCLVVAKTAKARDGISDQFLARTVFKGYLAISLGAPKSDKGMIDQPISRHPRDRKRFTSNRPDGRPSRSAWRVHARNSGLAVVAVRIFTGRTHQIRVHLADRGFPVAADDLYALRWQQMPLLRKGALHAACADGPLLHATRLAFVHPATKEPMAYVAPLPQRFLDVLGHMDGELPGELTAQMVEPQFFGGEDQ
jgi:23S rRNA pseudouridine1911/1915/1917 synthase